MIDLSRMSTRILGLCFLISLTACAPSAYMVKPPAPSAMKYELVPAAPAPAQLSIVDERRGDDRTFSSGVLTATLKVGADPIDAPSFLAKYVGEELAARGLPVKTATADAGVPKVHLKTFHIQNHRASGFSPFFTFTYISADLETAAGAKRVGVYVRRGKVPVWSFDEVIEPTFNQPLSIAMKEFASKVANNMYGYHANDAVVSALVAKVNGARTPETYLDVYELGFTNNPKAIDALAGLTKDTDEAIRQAAISSLGNIGATGQLPLLKSIYQNTTMDRHDRDFALKAIADLGTPEAREFISGELKRLGGQTTTDSAWTSRILALYL